MPTETMKALVKSSQRKGLELLSVAVPTIGPHEVLIRVKATSICGSDIPVYDWDDPWVRETVLSGQIIGHEFCGTVVRYGEQVHMLSEGDLVTVEGHLNCGVCNHCRRGEGHICPHHKLIGFNSPGSFAEFIAAPASNVIRLEDRTPMILGSLLDPFGNAVHAAKAVSLVDSSILVTGCGPIGLMTMAIAKLSGARRIFVSDFSEYRLALARAMGADVTFNPNNTNVTDSILEATRADYGVDIVFEMSGSPDAIVQGFKSVRPGGEVVMLGLPKQDVTLDFSNDLIGKGIRVHGIVGRRLYSTWLHALGLLVTAEIPRRVNVLPMITHLLAIEEYEQGFDLMRSGQCGKVLLFMDEQSRIQAQHEITALNRSA